MSKKTTSRRQGLDREVWSEGSRRAKSGVDVQEGDTRLSSRGEAANDADARWKRNRVNRTAIRGRGTFLSGEICLSGSNSFVVFRNPVGETVRYSWHLYGDSTE
jgi:hypothetical protein